MDKCKQHAGEALALGIISLVLFAVGVILLFVPIKTPKHVSSYDIFVGVECLALLSAIVGKIASVLSKRKGKIGGIQTSADVICNISLIFLGITVLIAVAGLITAQYLRSLVPTITGNRSFTTTF